MQNPSRFAYKQKCAPKGWSAAAWCWLPRRSCCPPGPRSRWPGMRSTPSSKGECGLGSLPFCQAAAAPAWAHPVPTRDGMCRALLLPGRLVGLVSRCGVVPCPSSGQPHGHSQAPSLGQVGSESAPTLSSPCGQGHSAGGPRDEPVGGNAHLCRPLLPRVSLWWLWLLRPPSPPPSSRCPHRSPALGRDRSAGGQK